MGLLTDITLPFFISGLYSYAKTDRRLGVWFVQWE